MSQRPKRIFAALGIEIAVSRDGILPEIGLAGVVSGQQVLLEIVETLQPDHGLQVVDAALVLLSVL